MALVDDAKDRVKSLVARFQRSTFGQLLQRFGEDQAALLATVVAYNAVFSMFPIMLAILALVGLVLRSPDAVAQAQGLVLSAVPEPGASSMLQVLSGIQNAAGWLGLIALVGLLWSGSGLFGAMEIAFDRVYRVPQRPFLRQKLMASGMVLLFAALIIAQIAAATVAQLVGQLAETLPVVGQDAATVVALAGSAISLLAAFALCFAIYYVVPNLDLTPAQVLPGALFASLALLLLTQLFPIYASLIGGFNQYGAIFGLFFLLMTWAYFVAQALLLGAEINALLRPIGPRSLGVAPEVGDERARPAA